LKTVTEIKQQSGEYGKVCRVEDSHTKRIDGADLSLFVTSPLCLFQFQWQQSNGKCGACGDPFGSFPENQYPGKYSQFPPQRTFTSGTYINATVYSRPNMLGWFEFRLCARKDGPDVTDLQACFDENVLQIDETGMTKFFPGSVGGYSDMHVLLPAGLSCDHCMLQWKYNTGKFLLLPCLDRIQS